MEIPRVEVCHWERSSELTHAQSRPTVVASNEAPPQFYAGSTYVVLAVLNELREGHRGLTLAYLRGSKLGRSHDGRRTWPGGLVPDG